MAKRFATKTFSRAFEDDLPDSIYELPADEWELIMNFREMTPEEQRQFLATVEAIIRTTMAH